VVGLNSEELNVMWDTANLCWFWAYL